MAGTGVTPATSYAASVMLNVEGGIIKATL
jgi:hypothetical protein